MNYKKFRFNAVIDWIELEIQTVNPTNFQTIKRHIERFGEKPPFVNAIDPGAGSAASQFRFKIQDPKNWQHVAAILNGVNDDIPLLVASIKVKSIEVSVDAYSKNATYDELKKLTGRFYRYLTNPVSQNHRFSGKIEGDVEFICSHMDVEKFLALERNICIGNSKDDDSGFKKYKADDEYMQIYFKKTDNGGTPITVSDYRARIEIRLQGSKLPCSTLSEWRQFKFESLSPYFNFRIDNNEIIEKAPEWYRKVVYSVVAQLGAIGANQRRKHSLLTLPDKELNNHVYEALRCLSDRMLSKREILSTLY